MATSVGIGVGLQHGRNAAGAFAPSDLTGLYASPNIALCRTQGKLWQDSGKTVAATAATHPVRVVVCPFTAVEFTTPSDAARPLLTNPSGSLWCLTLDGSDDVLAFPGMVSRPFSAHFCWRTTVALVGGSGFNGVGVTGATNSQKFKLYSDNVSRGGVAGISNWALPTTLLTGLQNTDMVSGLNYAATGQAFYWHQGVTAGEADPDVSNDALTVNVTRIGATTTGTELFTGRLYGWSLYTASQSNANVLRVHQYLGALAGLSL